MMPGFSSIYGDAYSSNVANYNNILNAYQQGQNVYGSELPGVYNAYAQVEPTVAGILGYGGSPWGVAAPAAQAIERTFAQQRGQTDQAMISAGLGNSTIRGSLQNQNALTAGQAYGNLGAQLAQTFAGYAAQTGLAAAGARMQGTLAQANLYGQQGSTLGYLQNRFGYGGYGGYGGGYAGGARGGAGMSPLGVLGEVSGGAGGSPYANYAGPGGNYGVASYPSGGAYYGSPDGGTAAGDLYDANNPVAPDMASIGDTGNFDYYNA